ncbi:MAG: hypothetical protein QNJ98_13965 [Planctomycetota bacterium]|nr:hypothetical protein [Planctomycetota bacterium]
MKRNVLVLFSLVLVFALAACQGRRRIVAKDAPADGGDMTVAEMPEAAVEDMAVAEAMPEAMPMPDEGPEADAAADDLAGAAAEAAGVEADRRQFLVQKYIEQANAALRDSGDIEAAKGYFRDALDLDPSSQAALEGLRRLSSDRPSTVADYAESQAEKTNVRREMAATEVRSHIDRGRTLETQENYAGAVKEYRKALAIISWYDETADFGITAERIRDLIDQTKYKSELAERAARQEQLIAAQEAQESALEEERTRRLGRIHAYFTSANDAFRRQDYALAREYARQILREDPTNADAEKLITISHDAEHINTDKRLRAEFDDQWKAVMQEMEYMTLPQVATVEFPDDWLDEIAHRKPRAVGDADDADESESIAGILSVLQKKRVKGLSWEEATLDDVVAYLRTITGLNFFVTAKARDEKGEDVAVTLKLDDVSVATILDIVTEQNELKWLPEGGVIKIATSDEVSGTMKLRYFDVKDLSVAIADFVGQEINLTPSNFTPPEPPELDDPTPIFPGDAMPDLIQQTIGGEGSWDDPASIEFRAGILIVRNTKPILDQIAGLLDELRANTGILVNLEVRFLTAEDNFLRDVGVDVRGLGDNAQGIGAPGLGTAVTQDDVFFGSPANPQNSPFNVNPEPSSVGTANDAGIFYNDGQDGSYAGRVENLFDVLLGNPGVLTGSGGLSFQHTFLDDTQMEVILRAVEKSERIQQITAPRITVYNTQRANVQLLSQVPYVADYEVEIAQLSNIANPVIQYILDGVVLDVQPVVSADRRFVSLTLRPTVAVLTRPIATFSTSLASGPIASAPVVIQIPELRVSRVRTTVNMPDKGTLLLGGLRFYEQETLDSGIPLLSKIPILSFLVSRKGNYVNRRNLMVLITAEIVNLEELEPRDNRNVPEIPSSQWTPVRPYEATGPCEVAAPAAPDPCDPCSGR